MIRSVGGAVSSATGPFGPDRGWTWSRSRAYSERNWATSRRSSLSSSAVASGDVEGRGIRPFWPPGGSMGGGSPERGEWAVEVTAQNTSDPVTGSVSVSTSYP